MEKINPKQEKVVNRMMDLMESEGFLDGLDIMNQELDELIKKGEMTEEEGDGIGRYVLQLFGGLFGDTKN